jgi:HAD superfamily hydrolase (TIGR01509 family)
VSARLPAAVLWDLDGTLIDSEPYWFAEEQALVESFGGTWTYADALALVGRALLDSAAYILRRSDVDLTPEDAVDRLVTGVARRIRANVPWQPGARELLAALRDVGVPTGLVTMSYRPITNALASALPSGSFDIVVTGEDVTQGKPHPEPYLTGAARLGLAATECIAIEDSETGARSASAAGARTIVVPSVKAVPRMAGVVQIPTLVGVTPSDLVDLPGFAARPSRG